MKTSLSLSFLLLLTLLATVAFAAVGPGVSGPGGTPDAAPTLSASASLADVLGTTPAWQLQERTSYICPDGPNGEIVCTYSFDCERYFGLIGYTCHNPSGAICGGVCQP